MWERILHVIHYPYTWKDGSSWNTSIQIISKKLALSVIYTNYLRAIAIFNEIICTIILNKNYLNTLVSSVAKMQRWLDQAIIQFMLETHMKKKIILL